jgi:hypothetical protein
VSRRLTLSLGLRYELSPPAVEKNNKIANFDLDSNPGHPQLVLAGSEGAGRANEALQGVNYRQFAPRFGFAYSLPVDKTVIRGGYGWFYSNMITLGGMQSMEINPPNHLRVSLSTNPSAPVRGQRIQDDRRGQRGRNGSARPPGTHKLQYRG